MPREFRKRGRGGNKQKDDEEYGEVPQAIQPIVATHDVMELAQETEEDGAVPRGSNEDTTKDPNLADFPLLTPDLKAYWREIDEKLQELERLGLGSYHSNSKKPSQKNEEDDEDEEDERQLLLRSALAELGGHELALASDPETSIILERIIFSMDGFAKRVLVDRFIGRFVDLSNHPHGSHVLQTLLASCASVLDVEASQSNSNKNPKDEMDQDEDLPLMCELLSQVCEDILPHLEPLACSPSGSHVLLVILSLCFGKPTEDENVRSKKSTQWRSKQGSLRSVFQVKPTSSEHQINPDTPSRRVPSKLRQKGESVYAQMRRCWGDKNRVGGVRSVASNPAIVVLLQLIIEIEFDREEAEAPGSLTDIILDGLFQTPFSSERSEFVEVSLRDVTASRVIERILSRLSPVFFRRFHAVYLVGRMGHLAGHPVANFVITRAVSQLDQESLGPAVEEVKPKLIDCIDNYRIGFFKALVERSASLDDTTVHEEVVETILKAFGIEGESEYRWIFPCMISLMRMDYFRKTVMFNLLDSTSEITQEQVRLPESNVQGSVLLQAILHTLPRSLEKIITKGLADLPIEVIIGFSRDPIGSRALDALLKSPSVTSPTRRHFTMRFLGKFHQLADDRIGSHIAETIWAISDVYLKEKIASSLVSHQVFLQKSSFGHFFLKKLDLPLFERQREAWKSKMAIKFPRISFLPSAKPSAAASAQLQTSDQSGLDESKKLQSKGTDIPEEAPPHTSKKESSKKKKESHQKRAHPSSNDKASSDKITASAPSNDQKGSEKKNDPTPIDDAKVDSTEARSSRRKKLKKDKRLSTEHESSCPIEPVVDETLPVSSEPAVKKKSKKRKSQAPPVESIDTSIVDQLFQPLDIMTSTSDPPKSKPRKKPKL
ncbi:hypothetical protein PCANC_00733 [Puccinia coronata f. sp. avenae]|uniref:Nucleolar protein 9 n=1 Tax=Puccinia coronata f. sp. avenae TaxID=200324 RepID=A0A2N5W713_9BASI|nr:hypothetical protein PCANC_00733 [Puccinia coronata f. sp. avenae]